MRASRARPSLDGLHWASRDARLSTGIPWALRDEPPVCIETGSLIRGVESRRRLRVRYALMGEVVARYSSDLGEFVERHLASEPALH